MKRTSKYIPSVKVEENSPPFESASTQVFPPDFLIGLRKLVESGWTIPQLSGMFLMLAGLKEVIQEIDEDEFLYRCDCLAKVMKRDADYLNAQRELAKRRKKKKEHEKMLQRAKKKVRERKREREK